MNYIDKVAQIDSLLCWVVVILDGNITTLSYSNINTNACQILYWDFVFLWTKYKQRQLTKWHKVSSERLHIWYNKDINNMEQFCMIDVANATKLDLLIAEVLGEIKVTRLPQSKAKRSELISYRNTR